MEYQQIIKVVTESALIENPKVIVREYQKNLESVLFVAKPLKIITGLRRTGKSFLLKQIYQILLKNKIPQQNILFINFESDLMFEYLSLTHLRNIYEAFYRKAEHNIPFYLLLDEIQNIKHWERFIRTIYDSTSHNIFITGSNSQLLSKEFATTLGGRILQFEIYPFSFQEILNYREVKYDDSFSRIANDGQIKNIFDQYLTFGGLPEIFSLPDNLKVNYRQNLVEKIIINDILKRFEIKSTDLLYRILQYLEKNIGTIVSFNNLANVAGVNEKTIGSYISYLNQTFLTNPLYKFSLKTKQLLETQKKYYFIDNLFINIADVEDKLENTVFINLGRKYGTQILAFGRDERGHEIDFVVRNENDVLDGFQVCYQLTDTNFDREIRSLLRFQKTSYPKNVSLNLIYMNDNRTKKITAPGINLQNIVSFLIPQPNSS